ncbi:MAG: hypothetical protein H5T73_04470 [Actinobacteria bacterium]|nr:hypothetical protein [Actinomycetota bacterium]
MLIKRLIFGLVSIFFFLEISSVSVLATPPKQAKGAHSSGGSGVDRDYDDIQKTRYFAEGYTGYSSNWISIFNITGVHQFVSVRCYDDMGESWFASVEVGSGLNYRKAINLNAFIPAGRSIATKVVAPSGDIMAERATYKGQEGSCSSGTGNPHYMMYFAEGYSGHDVYISIFNTSTSSRNYDLTFYGESGPIRMVTIYGIPPQRRATVKADDYIPGYQGFSTIVSDRGMNSVLVAERSSYVGTIAMSSSGTYSPFVIGDPQYPSFCAEGYTDFDNFIAIQNLGPLSGTWRVEYRKDSGNAEIQYAHIQKWSRGTTSEQYQNSKPHTDISEVVYQQTQYIEPCCDYSAERASYFGSWGTSNEAHHFLRQRETWYFSEVYLGHDVYFSIYNYNPGRIKIYIRYYTDLFGPLPIKSIYVDGGARYTIHVNSEAINDLRWGSFPCSCGVKIWTTQPLGGFAVERTSYFN